MKNLYSNYLKGFHWKGYFLVIALLVSLTCANAQQIQVVTSNAAANLLEATPGTPDDNPADLRIQSKKNDSKIALVKFSLSGISGVESAGVRLYAAQHEDEVNGVSQGDPQRPLVTPYRVMMVPVANTSWDASFTWNDIGGEGGDVLPRNVYRVSEASIIDFNKPHMNGKDSKYQFFGGPIIANYLNEQISGGATEVAFAFIAMDSVDVHDAWMGGTWRNPELHVTEGNAPTKLVASDVAELFEASPDQLGNADVGDLRIQTTSGASVKSTIKFDLSDVTQSVSNAAIQVYGAQHNDEAGLAPQDRASEYLIELFETNAADWSSDALTYNNYPGEADQAVAVFDMYNPNNGAVLNRLRAYQSHIISNKDLTELINQYISEGKTEISFTLVATETNDDYDSWVGGTFRGPELYLEHGLSIQNVTATVAVQVDSSQPDVSDPDGDMNDLDIQTKTDGTIIRSYLKFDIEGFNPDDIKYVTINPYGAQKGTDKTGPYSDNRFLVDVLGVESDLSLINDDLTFNISETLVTKNDGGTDLVLARANIYEADRPHRILQYPEFAQQSLTTFVKERIEAGDTEVAFEFTATEVNDQGEGAWLAGLWRPAELTIYSNSRGGSSGNEIPEGLEVAENLEPIDDTWVGEAEPNANHDGEADMNITQITGDQREAYVKYDLTNAVEADYVSFYVRGAQQGADPWTAIDNFYVDVYGGSDNSWNDAGMTWANKVDTDSDVLGTVNFTQTSSDWFTIASQELTDYVNAQIAADASAITLVLRGRFETPGSRGWISSSDWQTPELRLFYEASDDVEAPVFDPAAGLYPTPSVSIELSSATEGADIYYTLDGSVPTSGSTLYEGAISFTGADGDRLTVRAVAVKDGVSSSIVEGEYILGEQKPYSGTAVQVPGQVDAWEFDTGGFGVAYSDTVNPSADCGDKEAIMDTRPDMAGVDGCCADGECEIGWMQAGDWYEYTVTVPAKSCFSSAVIYNKANSFEDGAATIRIEEVNNAGEVLELLVDDADLQNNSDDWGKVSFDNAAVVLDGAFQLDAGEHVIRVTAVADNFTFGGIVFNQSLDCESDVLSAGSSSEFTVYPNPLNVDQAFTIHFENSYNEKASLVLRDVNGKVVQQQSASLHAGLNSLKVRVNESIKNGVYFIEMTKQDGKLIRRLVLNR